MTELNSTPDASGIKPPNSSENRLAKIVGLIYKFLSSVKLALTLLIAILICCVVGVTLLRGDRSWELIFSTLWFNSLLVLLVVNVAFCFVGRIWGRKLTVVSFGMLLFHLSFIAMLGGIVYNSLFYFRGVIRLTEGETLPSGQLQSYDSAAWGRFFDFSRLKGDTTLIKIHTKYSIEGKDKRLAYEISVGEKLLNKQGLVYITKHLDFNNIRYFPDREGYSVLIVLFDKRGRELYGAYVPFQSLKQKDGGYLYTSGTKDGPGSFPFPQYPVKPLLNLQVAYRPSLIKDRTGDAFFQVWPLDKTGSPSRKDAPANGKSAVGELFHAGNYYLSVKEVRYWAGMFVSYEPGQPIVLASLWVGLSGMVLSFIGRMRKEKQKAISL